MYLNYSISKTFNLLLETLTHFMMWIIIICVIILGIILYVNKGNSKIKYLLYIINIVLISLILYFYHNNLLNSLTFKHITHNLYFYFLNIICYLITFSIYIYKKVNKCIIIHYLIQLIFIVYALFMTSYVNNIHLIVIGNIYPMIVYGNYLCFIFYLWMIYKCLKKILTNRS